VIVASGRLSFDAAALGRQAAAVATLREVPIILDGASGADRAG
jgi:hypothetical protein